ncbi:hypothetical protein BD626DRAFT_487793, partial [Schizophyllum amplum]
ARPVIALQRSASTIEFGAANGPRKAWIQEEDESREEEDVPEPYGSERDMDEKTLGETIAMEDKLGILALGDILFNARAGSGRPGVPVAAPEEWRLVSPYSDDEPVDHEALYLSLRARRKESAKVSTDETVVDSTFGSLFFGKD